MVALLVSAVAALMLGGASTLWGFDLRIRNGLVLSAVDGRARVYVWDITMYRIDYKPGLDVTWNESPPLVEWWPYMHVGTEPAGYALPGRYMYIFAMPLWMISLGFLGGWWGARRAGWHRRPWECRRCGYDLRGLPEPLCPECGRRTKVQ